MSTFQWRTVAAITVGAVLVGATGYAIYFDQRRRKDPKFRRALKREGRRAERIARSEAEAEGQQRKSRIKDIVDKVKAEEPPPIEEREDYFLDCIKQGEILTQTGGDEIDCAYWFYKGIKVYPQPLDLMQIYDKTVAKPILDILAEMIALDSSIGGGSLDD